MYKRILTVVAALSFNQIAVADNVGENNSDVFKCIDAKTLSVKEDCVANTFANNIESQEFFTQLAYQADQPNSDAFATITYFPKRNLIEVKSLEPRTNKSLIASR